MQWPKKPIWMFMAEAVCSAGTEFTFPEWFNCINLSFAHCQSANPTMFKVVIFPFCHIFTNLKTDDQDVLFNKKMFRFCSSFHSLIDSMDLDGNKCLFVWF